MAFPPPPYALPHCWIVDPKLSDEETVTAEDMLYPSTTSAEMQNGCWNGLNLKFFASFKTQTLNCTAGLDAFGVDNFYDFTMSTELKDDSGDVSPFPLLSASRSSESDPPQLEAYVRLVMCDQNDPAFFCIPYQTVGRELVEAPASLEEGKSTVPVGEQDRSPANGEILGAETYKRFNIPQSVYVGEHDPNAFYTPFQKIQNTTELMDAGFYDSNGWQNFTVGLKALKAEDRARRRFTAYAHVAVFLTNQAINLASNGTLPILARQRYDMAIPILSNSIVFLDPVTKVITTPFKIAMGVIVGCIVLFQCAVLAATVRHRTHKVMQLSQAPLLIAMLMATIATSMASYLLIPAYNSFCYLQEPLVLTPLTLAATILLSRLWRIQSILSAASIIGIRNNGKTKVEVGIMTSLQSIAGLAPSVCCINTGSSGGSTVASSNAKGRRSSLFRQTITMWQVMFLSFVLLIPQLLMQILNLAVPACSGFLTSEVNIDMQMGRTTCSTSSGYNISSYVGWTLMVLPFIFTLILAHFARHLPSLFNETHHIFSTARVVALVCVVGFPLFALSNNPDTSPDITAFVKIAIVNSITLSICWFIVGNKLRLIYSGENVVVSNLLTGGGGRSRPMKRSWTIGPKEIISEEEEVQVSNSLSKSEEAPAVDNLPPTVNQSDGKKISEARSSITSAGDKTQAADMIIPSSGYLPILPNEALPTALENEILQMKELLAAILERTLAGRPASRADLELLADTGGRFGDTCRRMEMQETVEKEGDHVA